MAAEELLNLLDSYWFHHEIFSSKPCLPIPSSEPIRKDDEEHHHHHHHHHPKKQEKKEPEVSEVALFRVRSLSDRCLRCNIGFIPDAADQSREYSPTSVIPTQGIEDIISSMRDEGAKKASKNRMRKRSVRKGKGIISRSLSELEYEELKGFMDLGFVFSEEDKASNLVSILPGLQKLGQNKGSDHDQLIKSVKFGVSRPYLSEAWDGYRKKANKPMVINWRFPPTCNENVMKLHLKAWAHIVASSVR